MQVDFTDADHMHKAAEMMQKSNSPIVKAFGDVAMQIATLAKNDPTVADLVMDEIDGIFDAVDRGSDEAG